MLPVIQAADAVTFERFSYPENKLLVACREGNEEALIDALSQGHPLDGEYVRDEGGFITPLGMAVEKGYIKLVEILIKSDAKVDIPCTLSGCEKGPTPLEFAKKKADEEQSGTELYKKIHTLLMNKEILSWRGRAISSADENLSLLQATSH